jgi:hypothetical protein
MARRLLGRERVDCFMSRARYVLSLVLSAGLAALALGALGVSSASAATSPALKVCKLVPLSGGLLGLYSKGECLESQNVVHGAWAWSWADDNSEATIYCVLGGSTYSEGLCESTSGTLGFLEHLTHEAFPDLLGLLLTSTLIGHAATIATEIQCPDGDFLALPATATLTIDTTITYLGCKALKPANCEVSNLKGIAGQLKTEPLTGKLESLTLNNFVPQVAGPFIEIEYKGSSCSLKEKAFPVKGSQMCKWSTEATKPATEQLLNCLKTESSLTLGTESATYEGLTHVHFAGLPFWKIR